MEVLIFKTSVQCKEDVGQLTAALNQLVGNGKWNFALDDHDHVLRIVSPSLYPQSAIRLLANYGFLCAELEDVVPIQNLRPVL